MAFKLFFTEVASPFAQALLRELEHYTFAIVTPSVSGVIDGQIQDDPGIVIDTRAYTSIALVDELEMSMHNLPVIHISSHEVFTVAENGGSYSEQDIPNGTSPRALALIAAEAQALEHAKTLILRLPLLVDINPDNWFAAFLGQLSTESWLSVSETTRLDPVCTKEACRVVIAVVQQITCGAENWGVMHLRSAEPCFEAEFADHLVRQLKKEHLPAAQLDVIKGPSIWTGSASVLVGRRITDTFGVQMRSWRLGVKSLMQRWVEQKREEQGAADDIDEPVSIQ
ncbi:MAG TPA: sugar nucleotide-binding protein [Cellvibrionaceae bacterium]